MVSLRLVLDTNIVVSAMLNPDGVPRTILVLAATKPARLFVSPEILDEYRTVLARPKLRIRKGLQQQLMAFIQSRSRQVRPTRSIRACSDESDNKFLECAESARADYLITGNPRHFPRFWKQTKVISPREFLEVIAPHLLSN